MSEQNTFYYFEKLTVTDKMVDFRTQNKLHISTQLFDKFKIYISLVQNLSPDALEAGQHPCKYDKTQFAKQQFIVQPNNIYIMQLS